MRILRKRRGGILIPLVIVAVVVILLVIAYLLLNPHPPIRVGTPAPPHVSVKARPKKNVVQFKISGDARTRQILHKVLPRYPAWAEEEGRMGTVSFSFVVTKEGDVGSNIIVTQTAGDPRLDEEASRAFKQWKFSPNSASSDGQITFRYVLLTGEAASPSP